MRSSRELEIGVQNGGVFSGDPILWDWSEPLDIPGLLDRMNYLANASSYREEHGMPNAIKIRRVESLVPTRRGE